jgi:hypothetical protein
VRIDNIGAIFMAENVSSGVCTRHIDTRYHFIQFQSFIIKVLYLGKSLSILISEKSGMEKQADVSAKLISSTFEEESNFSHEDDMET